MERSLPDEIDWPEALVESGVVDLQGNVLAGLLAGARPPSADFPALFVAGMNAIVRGILSDGVLFWDKGQLDVERERSQAPREALLGANEGADLRHVIFFYAGGGVFGGLVSVF